MNTNGLSPLMQAAVGGETQKEGILGGQEIAKQNENFQLDEENGTLMTTEQFGGEEGIPINDPDNILEGAPYGSDDFEYKYKVEEDGSYTLISKRERSVEPKQEGGFGAKGYHKAGGLRTGDTPMEMRSPYKNYQNPQDYKVFNWGNKPIPF